MGTTNTAVTNVAFSRFWSNLSNVYLPNNYVAKVEGKDLSDKNFTETLLNKLNGIEEGANAYTHPTSGVTAGTYRSVTVDANGHITAGTNPTTLEGYGITEVAASTLTGTIDIARLPHAALERCVVVADDDARFDLTTDNAQVGDTVKVTSTSKMYFIKDDTKLDSEDGYEEYKVGTAAAVEWSGVLNKPETFTPSAHTHTVSEITDFPESLKNPNAVTLTNASIAYADSTVTATDVVYDGSEAKSVDLQASIVNMVAAILKGDYTSGAASGLVMTASDVDTMMGITVS